jgi:hypothetical protein
MTENKTWYQRHRKAVHACVILGTIAFAVIVFWLIQLALQSGQTNNL